MSYRIAVIGDLDTVVGMGLAGASYAHVHEKKDETCAKLEQFMANPEIGLLLITHPAAEELRVELRRLTREKGMSPLVLRIPDKTGALPKVDELREIIKRTVGAEIVFRKEGK